MPLANFSKLSKKLNLNPDTYRGSYMSGHLMCCVISVFCEPPGKQNTELNQQVSYMSIKMSTNVRFCLSHDLSDDKNAQNIQR